MTRVFRISADRDGAARTAPISASKIWWRGRAPATQPRRTARF